LRHDREGTVKEDLQLIRVELKYCEACGALRLRRQGSTTPYCARCAKVMAELAHTMRTTAAEAKRA
jgi:ribosomal protein L37AE/L43A